MRIAESAPALHQPRGVSIPETWELRDRLHDVDDIVEYHQMNFVLLKHGDPDRVNTGVVSSGFFDVFGVKPLYGRTFVAADDDLKAPPVLVLSNAYWKQKFGGDPHVVGQVVQLNDKEHTIIGVLPPIPGYPNVDDVYMPTSACPFRARSEATQAHTNHRAFSGLTVFGRLKPGATVEQAASDAKAIAAGWTQQYPQAYQVQQTGFTATAVRLDDEITQNARPILMTLVGATGLVLLIACANVANLSLSRTLRRNREIALRTALGAGRARIIRQLLTESTLVALAGGVVGLVLAWPTANLLATFASRYTPRQVDGAIDGWVLAFTLGIALLTGVIFGVIPALSSRKVLVTSLRDGGSQAGDSSGRTRVRSLLVVAQVTVCFALVVAAGLFLRSLHRLSTVDLGYDTAEHVLTAQLPSNFSHVTTAADFVRFYSNVLARVQTIPGVKTAAVTNAVPFVGQPGQTPFEIVGQTQEDAQKQTVDINAATDDYFAVMGIPILEGRGFNSSDTTDGPKVAIINQSMAAAWRGREAIGTYFTLPTPGPPNVTLPPTEFQVIGVVSDVRQYGLDKPPVAEVYTPLTQTPGFAAQVLIRTDGDPMRLATPLKEAVHSVDDQAPVDHITTVAELKSAQLQSPALTTVLLTAFAILALGITVAGLGAVIATSVSQRTREFGLRMALGASRGSVLGMVMKQGALMLVVGLVLGIGGAITFSHALTQYLYQTPRPIPACISASRSSFSAPARSRASAPRGGRRRSIP